MGPGNSSPRKLTRELSLCSFCQLDHSDCPIILLLTKQPTDGHPATVGTDPKRSGRLIAQKLPLPPMPFLFEMRPSAASTFVCSFWSFELLSAGTAGMCPYFALLSYVLFFWLLGMVPAGQALCQIHPNTRPGNFYQGYGKLWAGCVAWLSKFDVQASCSGRREATLASGPLTFRQAPWHECVHVRVHTHTTHK